MDGLEASIISYSSLERTLRIDSEFYKKENLLVLEEIQSIPYQSFASEFRVSDGNHMQVSNDFKEKGIPYYRGQDIYSFVIEKSNPICISEKTYNLPYFKRSHLKKGDVLLSIVGAIIGNTAMVFSDMKATCSCKLAILRSNSTRVLPETLSIFIKSKYGQNQIQKFRRGTAQTGLLLEDIDQLFIPLFKREFQFILKGNVEKAYKAIEYSELLYMQAEQIFLYELNMVDFSATLKSVSIKSFTESFAASGRLDAEYYQPKYDEIIKILNHHVTTTIDSEFDVFKNNYSDYDELGNVGVVKTKQLNKNGINEDVDSFVTEQAVTQNKLAKLSKGDVLFASMGVGSLGKANVYYGNGNFVTDSTLKIFRKKQSGKIEPEVLSLFLQLSIGQELIYKYVVGSTGIINIYENDIFKIPIPVLERTVQEILVSKFKESFSLRMKSNRLLAWAKQAVELAIEQGEDVAMKWLTDHNLADV